MASVGQQVMNQYNGTNHTLSEPVILYTNYMRGLQLLTDPLTKGHDQLASVGNSVWSDHRHGQTNDLSVR